MSRRSVSSFARVQVIVPALLLCAGLLHAQGGRGGAARGAGGARGPIDTTTGFVVRDNNVIAYCSGCHVRDSSGYMQRISYERKTPEGWEMSVRRMAALNKVKLEPSVARTIVRYLSDHQGLAPTEVRPVRFESERRMVEYRYTADPRTEATCRACHSIGRVLTQRRTRDEWELLVATHRSLFPDVDRQTFRRNGPAASDSGPPPQHPMDVAIAHLARALPLRTPDWTAWSATMRPPHLEGTWVMSGNEPGKGAFFGRFTIARGAADGEFTTQAIYRYAESGLTVHRSGKSVVYTGFQWRGRSTDPALRARDTVGLREVMFAEPGWEEMSGRWFTGGYEEIGMDVSLRKLGASPVVAGISPRAMRVGTRGQEVTIFGGNLPRVSSAAGNIDFGPGVTVERIVRSTPDSITIRVDVDSVAPVGKRDLFVAGASLRDGAVVFNQISRIVVTPLAGLARIGGIVFPKQLQQFEAVAYYNGRDGKPDTDDDLEIGRVNAKWSIEEYGVTYDDDDIKFVGAVDQTGLFTPNEDGPNPKRSSSRNNVGDVWVVASYQPPGTTVRPLKARAQLVVTVPLYVKFVPWRTQP
ncbi:MAG: quinohemoprotein amine dehydrogenase subunit alpha [bacterium]